jgi:hypothetical protein
MISNLIVLVVFGLVAWLVDKYIPMLDPVRTVFRVVVVVLLIVWLLQFLGVAIPGSRFRLI